MKTNRAADGQAVVMLLQGTIVKVNGLPAALARDTLVISDALQANEGSQGILDEYGVEHGNSPHVENDRSQP